MTTAQYQVTDFTTDTAPVLKAKIDANSEVAKRIAAAYQCYAAATPDMTVKVAAGAIMVNGGLVTNAVQTSGTITAPVTNPRIDRVVIDQLTGVASIITGAENASPTAPAITAGKVPIAQIALTTGTTAITNSLITDERAALVTLNINALAEDTSPDLAADFLLEWDTSAGEMRKVKPNRVGIQSDQVARDQIALTNIRLMLNSAITTGALVQGKQWELGSDEWGATSTNETYTSATPNYYANTAPAGGSSGTPGGSLDARGFTIFDRSWAVTNGQTISKIGVYSGSAGSVTVKIGKRNSATDYDVVVSQVFAHPGGGWADCTLATPYTVPGSGTYHAGAYDSDISNIAYNTSARAYVAGDATGNGVVVAEDSSSTVAVRVVYASPNMTLIPDAAVSVSAAPTYMSFFGLYKDDSGSSVLGTDLTIELSRDNGTTYTSATITTVASYDGTYSVIKGRIDVSAQPSGTSLLCRIKTLNNKAQRVAAPALYAE